MYKVSFYTLPGKISPIEKFLLKLSPSQEAKIVRSFTYLSEYRLTKAIPNLRKLTNTPFWEIRILGKNSFRIICFPREERDIVILHIFSKKKRKMPSKELNTATKRYKALIDN